MFRQRPLAQHPAQLAQTVLPPPPPTPVEAKQSPPPHVAPGGHAVQKLPPIPQVLADWDPKPMQLVPEQHPLQEKGPQDCVPPPVPPDPPVPPPAPETQLPWLHNVPTGHEKHAWLLIPQYPFDSLPRGMQTLLVQHPLQLSPLPQ